MDFIVKNKWYHQFAPIVMGEIMLFLVTEQSHYIFVPIKVGTENFFPWQLEKKVIKWI